MKKEKIVENTLITIISRIFNLVLGTVKVIIIVRFIPVADYGVWTFANYFSSMFLMFAEMGLNQIITRDVASDFKKAGSYLATSFYIRIVVSFLLLAIIFLINKISKFPEQTETAIMIVSLSFIITSFSGIFSSLFQAHQNLKTIAIISMINDCVSFILIFTVLVLGFKLNGILLISLIISFLNLSIYVIHSRKIVSFSLKLNKSLFYYLIKEGYPLMIGAFIISVYKSMNPVFLKYIKGDETAAIFNAPFTIISYLGLVPFALTQAIFPVMSKLHHIQGKELLNKLFKKSIFYLNIVSIPMTFGVLFLSPQITRLLFGSKYDNASSVLQILIFAVPLSFVNWVIYSMFTSIQKQKLVMYIYITVLIIDLISGVLLIPKYSVYAAGVIIVFTELYFLIIGIYFLKKYNYELNLIKNSTNPILSSILMVIFLYFSKGASIFIIIPAAASLYFIILFKINTFSVEDKTLFKQLVNGFIFFKRH